MSRQEKHFYPFIQLTGTVNGKPHFLNLERIACYSEGNDLERGDTWIALSGRSTLLWVREKPDQIKELIIQATKEL